MRRVTLRKGRLASVLAAVVTASWVSGAAAATITRSYAFAASDPQPIVGSTAAPTDPVSGSFTVTFDPTVAVTDVTSGIMLNSLNIPLSSAISFAFTPFGQLTIGGLASDVGGVTVGENDFELAIFQPLSATPIFGGLFYSKAGVSGAWSTGTGSITVVPEPATWALMLAGFFGLGAALRASRRGLRETA